MSDRTPSELRALVRLLGDDDERTAQIARAKLKETGEPALPYLAETVRDPDARIRARSRLLIEAIQLDMLKDRFVRYAALPEDQIDLETGAFLIASYGYPEVDMTVYRRRLDELAARVQAEVRAQSEHRGESASVPDVPTPEDPALPAALTALNRIFFEHEGFRGNEEAYYDPDNSYLNRVLDRRCGIPISLSVVYILLAKRLNLPVYGVGLPGHFIVGYHPDLRRGTGAIGAPSLRDPTTALWIDPFNRGRVLTLEDCHRLVRNHGYNPDTAYLQPAPVRLIVVRMMLNLVNIYRHTNRTRQAAELSELIRIVLRNDDEDDLDDGDEWEPDSDD